MSISNLLTAAFNASAASNVALHKSWINASFRVGAIVPHSLLAANVQKCGQLDMLIQAIENEISQTLGQNTFNLEVHYQMLMSELWVGSLYEVCRLLDERGSAPSTTTFKELSHRLRLLRIPLEKMQIAADKKLKVPLQMIAGVEGEADAKIYSYEKNDPNRSHIMPTGLSARGATAWQVVDIVANKSFWVERRSLSEAFITEFGQDYL